MKFEIVIGNPPYQEMTGGGSNIESAMPVYHRFVERAIQLKPEYITMIIPSRWMAGGKSVLDGFRASMVDCRHITDIYNFEASQEVFNGVEIAGGIQYFLYCSNIQTENIRIHNCITIGNGISVDTMERDLSRYKSNEYGDNSKYMIIADNDAARIIDKTLKRMNHTMESQVLQQIPFGLGSDFEDSLNKTESKAIKVYCSNGRTTYTDIEHISRNREVIEKWKVCIGYKSPGRGVNHSSLNIINKPVILEPWTVCSQSYIIIDCFDTLETAEKCEAFMRLKFTRYMIAATLTANGLTSKNFMFTPVGDYSKAWTDEELYEKYELIPCEREIIERKIRTWE